MDNRKKMMLRRNILVITWVFIMSQWTTVTTQGYSFITCTNSGTFRVIFDISIDRCIEECQRRKRCLAIMFYRGLKECKLKENTDSIMSNADEPLCSFVNMTDVDKGTLGQCSESDCAETERCESSSDGFKCVKTECSKPNNISNAFLLSNVYAVGQKNRYKCNNDYYGLGDPSITCTDDGTWTPTTFTCYHRFYENAEVTAVKVDSRNQETVIHFKCRPDFQTGGAYATSVINVQGDWEPSVVPCCPNNTEFLKDSCITLHNGSSVGSKNGMFDYCKDTGGSLKWLGKDTADYLFGKSEYHFLMNNINKEDFSQRFNLILCLEEYMDNNTLASILNLGYDNLVQVVLSNDFKGKKCESARYWSPGQPNGGTAENCIAISRDNLRMHDINCNVNSGQSIGFVCTYLLPDIHV